MKTVYKFALDRFELTAIAIPAVSKVVYGALQGDEFCLWMEVDADKPPAIRQFQVFGTGHDLPPGSIHCATFFDGPFVWHIYELA